MFEGTEIGVLSENPFHVFFTSTAHGPGMLNLNLKQHLITQNYAGKEN